MENFKLELNLANEALNRVIDKHENLQNDWKVKEEFWIEKQLFYIRQQKEYILRNEDC